MSNEERTERGTPEPELHRPQQATKDLEPDEQQAEQVRGGLKESLKIK
jgi:hypothetical protein